MVCNCLFQDENLDDILVLVTDLMGEHPASMVPGFDRKRGSKYGTNQKHTEFSTN